MGKLEVGSDFSGVEWKPVVGYEGCYMVSSIGDVISLERIVENPVNIITPKKYIKPAVKRGYHCVVLFKNGKRKHVSIHRLVAIAFILNPKKHPQVNHINGIKTDNRVENLEWCTSKENIKHSIDKNLRPFVTKSKLKVQDVLDIRKEIDKGVKNVVLAKKYKVNRNTIGDIKNNITWNHI